ncbi:MAG TPA: glycosyltransferase family 4 protein [Herpetosiphonaceae bacterium]
MTTSHIRILGITMDRIGNFRAQAREKNAGMYAALDRRFGVIDVIRPRLPMLEQYYNKLRHIHPDRDYWRIRAGLNPWAFKHRTAVAERRLQGCDGQYDLIVQLHTLFSPGDLTKRRPYVLHTDNTYQLSERYYADWAPLRGRQRDEWIAMERATYRQAAFLFPRSEWLRRSMIDDYGCEPERVIRVGGGANFVRSSLDGKAYDAPVALFVGYDFKRKGGHVLLQAWEQVHRQLPEAQLWIVGPERLRARLPGGVRCLGRIDDRAALRAVYAQASVFTLPALFEPWGHVITEAMGEGLPCVVSDRCALPEIVAHGVTGLVTPAEDPAALAAALIDLLGNPRRAERFGRQAHATIAQGNTWDDVIARMAPYIEQAAEIAAPSASMVAGR